ncbi:MAG: phosphoribosyltransferase family protein [Burkholderiaceae bacterium]
MRRPAGAACACGDTAPFARTFALADYAPPLDRAVVALKFRGEIALGRAFAALAAPLVRALAPAPEPACAVPLSGPRLAARGYNQALAIAAPLARELGLPLAPALLARTRDTVAQSTLELDARARNLDGAFVALQAARGRRVLVVDDVMTSGAALAAAASALRSAGARHVANLVVARTA